MATKKTANAKVVPMQGRKPRTFNVDGWQNVFTAMGIKGRDKRLESRYGRDVITEDEAEELWLGSDMAAVIIEDGPGEIIRAGWSVTVKSEQQKDPNADPEVDPSNPDDPAAPAVKLGKPGAKAKADPTEKAPPRGDKAADVFAAQGNPEDPAAQDSKAIGEAIDDALDDLNVYDVVREALEYKRAYGGSAILLGVRDGAKDLKAPLDLKKVQALEWLTVLQPRELQPTKWYDDPRAPKYGRPMIYRLQQESAGNNTAGALRIDVHESRLIRFDGVIVSRRQLRMNKGWGASVLARVQAVLRDFDMSWDGTAVLLNDFAQAIFKIKGLAELMAADEDDTVLKRAAMVDMSRSVARAILIDADEDFKRETTSVAGLADLLVQFCNRLAAAARMPVTRLMGISPAGLNATGNADTRAYYDRIDAERERQVRQRLNRLIEVLLAAKDGPTGGTEPEGWSVVFNPLWQLDAVQESDRRLKNAQADVAYVNAGVITPEEVAAARFGGDEYGEDLKLDRNIREAFDQQAEQEAQQQAEQLQAQLKAGGGPGGPPGAGGPKPFGGKKAATKIPPSKE